MEDNYNCHIATNQMKTSWNKMEFSLKSVLHNTNAHPLGEYKGCLFLVQSLINFTSLQVLGSMQYHAVNDHAWMRPGSNYLYEMPISPVAYEHHIKKYKR